MAVDKLQQAIALIKSGDKKGGQNILIDLVNSDPQNETAWLWLASVVSQDKRTFCLEKVVSINPNNTQAKEYLGKLKANQKAQPSPTLQSSATYVENTPKISEQPPASTIESKTRTATLNFKYSFVNDFSFLASNGTASTTALRLKGDEIPYTNMVETLSRDNRFIIALAPNTKLNAKTSKRLKNNNLLVLYIRKIKAKELKKHVDRHGSAMWAENHKQQLVNIGKGNLFSTIICAQCNATIDLSESERTSYIFCPYCESVINHSQKIISNSDTYNVCDECHMYDRVRGYTMFIFYFLIFIYGFSYNRRFLCDTCATKLAQRTLLINLLFILGIPSAIYMWIKSQSGREAYFQDLAKANKFALKGKYQEADEIYDKLFSLYPEHPGLLMNKGLGHLCGGDSNGGAGFLTRSMKACGNYRPSLQIIQRLQQAASQVNSKQKT